MGVVYHANYLVWFEVARSQLFWERVGTAPSEFFQTWGLPLYECYVQYLRPCRYDDEVTVVAKVTEVRSRRLRFEYMVINETDGVMAAEGYTVHHCTNAEGQPVALPPNLREAMQPDE